ncbi:MAG: MATE family efflux transporter, partial [Lachnospiraceae bacterium]|nr:MATE family efflux transporter [Lachnospiraceae bacterium]
MKKNGNRAGMESYRMIMRLALPIVIQNLFSAAISSTDVIMLNSVGQSAVSAVSLATQYSSVLYMVFYGIGTGATMLCAQYWGQGNTQAIEKIEGIALRFSLGISLLFAVPSAVVPGLMMTLFTSDQELIQIGASYLRIVSISFLCWGFSEVYLAILRSVEKVKISTALNVSALLINVCLNAVFVYGLFGAPRLGAQGVAIATAISRGIQLIACFGVSIVSGNAVRLRPEAMFWKSGVLMQDFLHLAVPAVANDISWSVAFSMYSVIMGHMGTDVVAANAIVVVVRNFGTVLCYSIASASGIYVGKKIGANQLEEAERDASRSMQLTVASGIFGGILVAASMP